MKNPLLLASAALTACVAAGCWTFSETPPVETPQLSGVAPERNVTVAVNGFKATVVEYHAVLGYQSYYMPGYAGRHHYHPGYVTTVQTTTYLPEVKPDEAFLMRARDMMESAGFIIGAEKPDWTMEVTFEGPFARPGEAGAEICWPLFTVFFCDYAATEWHAKLRVRDNRTGRLVLHHDYAERYETKVFGLIPLFSIAACDQTSPDYGKGRCLTALTDRAVADTTAELARLVK